MKKQPTKQIPSHYFAVPTPFKRPTGLKEKLQGTAAGVETLPFHCREPKANCQQPSTDRWLTINCRQRRPPPPLLPKYDEDSRVAYKRSSLAQGLPALAGSRDCQQPGTACDRTVMRGQWYSAGTAAQNVATKASKEAVTHRSNS